MCVHSWFYSYSTVVKTLRLHQTPKTAIIFYGFLGYEPDPNLYLSPVVVQLKLVQIWYWILYTHWIRTLLPAPVNTRVSPSSLNRCHKLSLFISSHNISLCIIRLFLTACRCWGQVTELHRSLDLFSMRIKDFFFLPLSCKLDGVLFPT